MITPSFLTLDRSEVVSLKQCKSCGIEVDGPYRQYCNKCRHIMSQKGVKSKICIMCNIEFKPADKNQVRCSACNKLCHRCGKPKEGKWAQFCKDCRKRGNQLDEIRICTYCSKEFKPYSIQQTRCRNVHYCKCIVCDKQIEGIKDRCCSIECQIEAQKIANRQVWDTDYPLQSEAGKLKARESNIEKYGVPVAMMRGDIQAKMHATNIERYGAPWIGQSEYAKVRSAETCTERYGVPYYILSDECIEKNGKTISATNRRFYSIALQVGLQLEYEFRLGGRSFDFRVVDRNILLEINPTYTHNAYGNHWWSGGTPKEYHQDKSKIAQDSGYVCIHIFEWDSIDTVLSLLLSGKSLSISQFVEPKLHWFNRKTREHIIDKNDNWDQMIVAGWLPVYDAGQEVSTQ